MRRDTDYILFDLDRESYSWKGIYLLCILYFGAHLFAAILSPGAYSLIQYLKENTETFGDTWTYLADKPYPKYFDRLKLLAVVIIFPLLFKYCKLWPMRKIGYRGGIPFSSLLAFFGAAIAMILTINAIQYASGALVFRDDLSVTKGIGKFATGIVSGGIVGLLEETLFRALVFRLFYTAFKPLQAILLSAAFFALMHFKIPSDVFAHLDLNDIGLSTGFEAAYGSVMAIVTRFDLQAFLNLTLVGILLNTTFITYGNLWPGIVLHAGWVAAISAMGKLTIPTGNITAFTGTHRLVDGWITTIELILFIAIGIVLYRKRSNANQLSGGK